MLGVRSPIVDAQTRTGVDRLTLRKANTIIVDGVCKMFTSLVFKNLLEFSRFSTCFLSCIIDNQCGGSAHKQSVPVLTRLERRGQAKSPPGGRQGEGATAAPHGIELATLRS